MPIGIGINENVFITEISQDKTSDAILISFDTFDASKPDGNAGFNYFEALGAEKVIEVESGSQLRLFAPNEPKDKETEEKRIKFAYNDINGTKAVIEHLMKGYMSAEAAAIGQKLYENSGITQDNFNQKIVQKPTLLVIHNNMARHFIEGMKPFLNKTDQLFRLLLIRQSTDKAFPTFRKKFLEDQPIWESMDVPKEQSKLAFTKYERDNKLDSNEPAPAKDKAENKSNGGSAPVSASAVFG